MKLRIAVVQFGTKPFATDDNLRRAEQFIEEGALAGTQLSVFPEDFLTGPISDRLELADHEGRFKGFFQYFKG
jgi:predicted amidohydrolase